ncbi:MAG: hypothetical protein J0M16_05130 [Gammaproteobacteria bacterium]|nr:hypothetical protein [Gammaproteobacteria bacterium]
MLHATPNLVSLATLALLAVTPAIAAPPDICQRQIEGVSLDMSFDAIKAEWTRRGYQDVTQLKPGQDPRSTLNFAKNGGSNLQNPGGVTLSWQTSAESVSIGSQQTGVARGTSPNELFQARYAELCPAGEVRTPELWCTKSGRNHRIDARSPLAPDNWQCVYSVDLSGRMGVTMVGEGVQKANKTRDLNKTDSLKQLMQGKKPPGQP